MDTTRASWTHGVSIEGLRTATAMNWAWATVETSCPASGSAGQKGGDAEGCPRRVACIRPMRACDAEGFWMALAVVPQTTAHFYQRR